MRRWTVVMLVTLSILAVMVVSCGGGDPRPSVPVNITFDVEGMTCGSCEAAIVESLMAMDGISSANATHSSGKVEATYDPSKATPEKMAAAIDRLGYTTGSWNAQE